MWFILIGLVITVVILLKLQTPAARRRRRGATRALNVARLEREYLRLLQMPAKPAQETLARALDHMQQEHPRRSRQWQLQKLIADLRRDKR